MKRICLTLFFATYYFFMPFVMVNCGSTIDEPFALSASTGATEDQVLAQCQSMQYLVESCVDVLAAEEARIESEKASVTAATLLIEDFSSCETAETISATSTVTNSTETIDCSTTVQSLIEAFQYCDVLSTSEKYDGCDDVESIMDDAVDSCDADSNSVTEDFCNSLTA